MPSNATVTAYYTFVANTKARAAEVNSNFSLYRGHIIPIEPLTATASNISHDLGSREHSWRVGYLQSLQVRAATSTVDFVIQGQTSVTAGAAEFLFGSTTIASMDITNGIYRQSLENAANRMTTTSLSTAQFSFTTTVSTWVNVTNMSLTIAVKKSMVEISLFGLAGDSATTESIIRSTSSSIASLALRVIRDTTTSVVSDGTILLQNSYTATGGAIAEVNMAASSARWFDNPGAGTYTYKLQASGLGYVSTIYMNYIKMRVREI